MVSRPQGNAVWGLRQVGGRPDADTFFQFEMPALQQWSFTQADAGRIEQPVLSVIGSESHTLWIGRTEVHELVQAWWPRSEAFVLQGAVNALQVMNPTGMAEGLAAGSLRVTR